MRTYHSAILGFGVALVGISLIQTTSKGQATNPFRSHRLAVPETQPESEPVAAGQLADGHHHKIARTVTEIRADISPQQGFVPEDLTREAYESPPQVFQPWDSVRPWRFTGYEWHSPAFFHRPVYFQQVSLERYGLSHKCLQPVLSGIRFYSSVALWPVLQLDELWRPRPSNVGFGRPGTLPAR